MPSNYNSKENKKFIFIIKKAASFTDKLWFIMLLSGITGAFLFILIYGTKILNPTYDDWLLEGGDLTQHYLGWIFFRKSGWHFPLGLIDNILGDIKISVMYTDSFPLLAIIFKLLSPILPETFQYYGLMGITTFILNGSIASLLMYRFNKNCIFCVLGSTFYIVTPVILQRLYGHESLACHFVIIFGFVLWLYQNHIWKNKWKNYAMPPILWGILGIIAVSIHIYYLPMIYCFLFGCFVTDIFKYKKYLRPLMSFASITLTSLLTLWIIGAFYTKNDFSAAGLGELSANINTFYNPLMCEGHGMIGPASNGSAFLKPIPVNIEQFEGYAYLGLGIILGAYLSFIVLLNHIFSCKGKITKTIKTVLSKRKVWLISGSLVFFVSFFYAVSPSCYINKTKIYDIYYSESIIRWMSAFRATGRFAWIGMYIIFTLVLYCFSRIRNKKLMFTAIIICLGLQFTDMKEQIKSRKWYKQSHNYNSQLTDPRWEQLADGCNKFVGLNTDQPEQYIYNFSIFAYKHNMSINHFHIARPPFEEMIKQSNRTLELLADGKAEKNTLYVFLSDEYIPKINGAKKYKLDNFYVVKFPNQDDPLFKIGDINGDGFVDAADALKVIALHAKLSTTDNYNTHNSLGDMNSDGLIDAVDASKILELYSKLSTIDYDNTDISLADMNGDGFIDAVDASVILTKYASLSTK